jgi:RNA recognition motif-containing protein
MKESKSILIQNLFLNVKTEDLKKVFSKCGKLFESRIIYDVKNLSTGIGWVTFENSKDALKSLDISVNNLGTHVIISFLPSYLVDSPHFHKKNNESFIIIQNLNLIRKKSFFLLELNIEITYISALLSLCSEHSSIEMKNVESNLFFVILKTTNVLDVRNVLKNTVTFSNISKSVGFDMRKSKLCRYWIRENKPMDNNFHCPRLDCPFAHGNHILI